MPETDTAERTRVLEWVAAYVHIKDYWQRTGRRMTADQKQSLDTALAAQKQHGITDAEITDHRHRHQVALDKLAAIQA